MIKNNLVGRFAESGAGHDKGVCCIIIAQDDEYLYLADGIIHTLDNPKKKNRKHVQLFSQTVETSILNRLVHKEKIFDYEIKYAIKIMRGKEEGYVKK